jgi:hypothetical protein
MRALKITLFIFCLCVQAALSAQEAETDQTQVSPAENEIGMETTEKIYKVYNGKEVIKNSVKITTEMSQEMMFSKEDEGKIDQERVQPGKKITKTVLIDNDDDDEYDEKIIFSYRGNTRTDFTLVTNDDEMLVALEEGDNLKVMESESVTIANRLTGKEAYVCTSYSGDSVELSIVI